jgi:signal transduction histidine kinase
LYQNRSAELSIDSTHQDRAGGAGASSKKKRRDGEHAATAKTMRRDDSPLNQVDPDTSHDDVNADQLATVAHQVDETARVVAVFRPFSLISFVAIAFTAILLAMCYRYVSIQSITEQAEASNVVVAQAAVIALEENLGTYLAGLDSATTARAPFPADIAAPLYDLIQDTKVRKVRIYDSRGIVVFSTKTTEVGVRQPNNPRVINAMAGAIGAKLIYHDRFNRFNGATEDDNLIQTYLPLQQQHAGPYVGVFEVHTDVSGMVANNEQTETIIVSTLVVVLMLLYFSLLSFVRRMERVIVRQENALRERSELLAALSARMVDSQEAEKQRIAAELHEGVAQTLAAVKLTVENAVHAINRGDETSLKQLEGMIPVLQTATQDVRSVAVGLRPPSLDELGLVATLRWLCRDFAEKNPHIRMESRLDLAEARIPLPLKATIFRVAEETCVTLSANRNVTRIAVSLDADDERIVLTVRENALTDNAIKKDFPYAAVRQRTLLSGGQFVTLGNAWGGLNMMATWLR